MEACQAGLSEFDALHSTAAKLCGAEALITTERPTTPLFGVTGIVITTIALPGTCGKKRKCLAASLSMTGRSLVTSYVPC